MSYVIHLSLTYFILGSSTSLQMALFHSFLWLSNIPLCICTTSSSSFHLLSNLDCFHVLAIVNSECCDGHWSESMAFFSTFPERYSQGLKQIKYNHVVQDQRWKGWREGTHLNSPLVHFFHYLRVY